jgi:endogenous inhibitor of DNA gyrase (YacG/DUF329 family)
MEWHCPICKKPTDSDRDKDFPFCTERCRLMDLGNWASEKYKVTEPATDEGGVDAPPNAPATDQNDEHEK